VYIFAEQVGSLAGVWQVVLRTLDPIPYEFDLNHGVRRISYADVFEGALKSSR